MDKYLRCFSAKFAQQPRKNPTLIDLSHPLRTASKRSSRAIRYSLQSFRKCPPGLFTSVKSVPSVVAFPWLRLASLCSLALYFSLQP
jgi:hypothetical protein